MRLLCGVQLIVHILAWVLTLGGCAASEGEIDPALPHIPREQAKLKPAAQRNDAGVPQVSRSLRERAENLNRIVTSPETSEQ